LGYLITTLALLRLLESLREVALIIVIAYSVADLCHGVYPLRIPLIEGDGLHDRNVHT
jgi:hypothetical protein